VWSFREDVQHVANGRSRSASHRSPQANPPTAGLGKRVRRPNGSPPSPMKDSSGDPAARSPPGSPDRPSAPSRTQRECRTRCRCGRRTAGAIRPATIRWQRRPDPENFTGDPQVHPRHRPSRHTKGQVKAGEFRACMGASGNSRRRILTRGNPAWILGWTRPGPGQWTPRAGRASRSWTGDQAQPAETPTVAPPAGWSDVRFVRLSCTVRKVATRHVLVPCRQMEGVCPPHSGPSEMCFPHPLSALRISPSCGFLLLADFSFLAASHAFSFLVPVAWFHVCRDRGGHVACPMTE
jgi:hypothetical protein